MKSLLKVGWFGLIVLGLSGCGTSDKYSEKSYRVSSISNSNLS